MPNETVCPGQNEVGVLWMQHAAGWPMTAVLMPATGDMCKCIHALDTQGQRRQTSWGCWTVLMCTGKASLEKGHA